MENENFPLSRRSMVALTGALGGGALLGAAGAATAHASGNPGSGLGARNDDVRTVDGQPASPRINSAPIGGYTYKFSNWIDFHSLDGGARAWSNEGAYSTAGTGQWLATVDLPPGAILRDVEWYFSATAGIQLASWIWTTGSANIVPVHIMTGAATASLTLHAQRGVLTSSTYGPYTHGAKLVHYTITDSTRRLNGVRAGFSMLPAGATMLATPTRVYDSRSGAKIGNGQTRIHSLASWIPAGATAAIINLHITSGEKSGGLVAYNTGSPLPSMHSLYWSGATNTHEMHVKLPSDRKIKVTARGITGFRSHYMIDVVGYIA